MITPVGKRKGGGWPFAKLAIGIGCNFEENLKLFNNSFLYFRTYMGKTINDW